MNAFIDHEVSCPHCGLIQDDQTIPSEGEIACEDCGKLFSACILIVKIEGN